MRKSKTDPTNQYLLPGFAPPAPRTSRLFFAIRPDTQAAHNILKIANGLRQEHALAGKILDAARLHATLLWLGDFAQIPEQSLVAIKAAAAKINFPTFTATFDRALSFSGRSRGRREVPLVLTGDDGVASIVELYRVLLSAMHSIPLQGISLNTMKNSFTPHITLLYDRQVVAPEPVASVTFNISEFVLFHSHVGQNRPYEIFAKWSLSSI